MFMEEESISLDLFAVDLRYKLQVDEGHLLLGLHDLGAPLRVVELLPCAPPRAHRGPNDEERLLGAEEPESLFALFWEAEVPWSPIVWIGRREIQGESWCEPVIGHTAQHGSDPGRRIQL